MLENSQVFGPLARLNMSQLFFCFFLADFWEVGHLARLTFHDWQQVPARELWYPSLSIELLATGEIHLYGNHLRNQGLDWQQLEYGKGLGGVIPSHHLFIVHDCTRPPKNLSKCTICLFKVCQLCITSPCHLWLKSQGSPCCLTV